MRREMFRNAMTPAEIDAFIADLKAQIAAGTFTADA
jgi:N-methylhydantoinase B/oxoprolinase/acetone carboxylase alpha subunit